MYDVYILYVRTRTPYAGGQAPATREQLLAGLAADFEASLASKQVSTHAHTQTLSEALSLSLSLSLTSATILFQRITNRENVYIHTRV